MKKFEYLNQLRRYLGADAGPRNSRATEINMLKLKKKLLTLVVDLCVFIAKLAKPTHDATQ